jgi:competence protein ComEC
MITAAIIKHYQRFKRFRFLALFLATGALIFLWSYNSAPARLEVDFLDVGQGDAILIKTPQAQKILIDGGPDNKVLAELATHLTWRDKTFDLLILTHPHADHLLGLIEILKRYEVKKILLTNVNYDNQSYHYFLELARAQKIPLLIVSGPKLLDFGANCYLKIIYPFKNLSGARVKKLNNSSIVSQLIYGQNKFLFTGDGEVETEKELLAANSASGLDLKSTVLKIGHHGSATASSLTFLQKVAPRLAVIEVGAGNKFGHPATSTLERLRTLGIKIWRTDLYQDLTIYANEDKVYYKKP